MQMHKIGVQNIKIKRDSIISHFHMWEFFEFSKSDKENPYPLLHSSGANSRSHSSHAINVCPCRRMYVRTEMESSYLHLCLPNRLKTSKRNNKMPTNSESWKKKGKIIRTHKHIFHVPITKIFQPNWL